MDDLNSTDFKSLSRSQTYLQMKRRLLALSHFKDGKSRTKISLFLKVSRTISRGLPLRSHVLPTAA